jgi:hypothetical protein
VCLHEVFVFSGDTESDAVNGMRSAKIQPWWEHSAVVSAGPHSQPSHEGKLMMTKADEKVYTHARAHTHTYIHTHTHHTHTRARAQTHIHTRARARAHTHTHTHTHTQGAICGAAGGRDDIPNQARQQVHV